ncbi:MAG: SDR family oxidoreductase [Rhodoglobus sp.]
MTSRRAVVTGASSGIGAATVRRLREHGWDVVGVARRADRLAALATQTGCDVFVADVTKQSDVDALAAYVDGLGAVHALVNNAGGARGMESVEESRPEDWQWMFDVNVLGTKRVTSAMLPLLRKGWTPGTSADILTVTSVAGYVPYEGGGGYNAAKFAERALVAVLRLELAGEPIRVIDVAPGMVETEEFSLNRFGGDAQAAGKVYENVQEPLRAEDIAEAIVTALELPHHVSIEQLTVRPVAQAAQHKVIRGPLEPRS